ncbi:DUF3168 domain-containing protein [Micromonospora sp. NPDC047730]|uniref:tail completion protein gp17 n=1 Tax=Micromonospora sp. NPDC047730 TaxID=3364253 RepID=UPI003710EE07
MIIAHAKAILALADADNDPPALVVLDGKVPDGVVPPYVLFYFADSDPSQADGSSLANESARYVVRAIAHCVGGNATAARAVAQRVRARLLDAVPTVAGRQCFPIRREEGREAERDEAPGSLVVDKVDVYRLETLPA